MTGVTAEIVVDATQLEHLWRQLLAASQARPALVDFGEYLLESHRFRFQLEISPEGVPWEPLDPGYLRSKRKRESKGPDRILVLDDFLRSTLNYQATDDELRFGTNRIYGATHQFGDESRNIPARRFLGFSDDDMAEFEDILLEHIAGLIA